jgi:hypothetical protein
MKESIVLKPYKKKIILFDTASIVDRNGSTVNILQPKIDNLDFWYSFLWKREYLIGLRPHTSTPGVSPLSSSINRPVGQ